jgi:hypothetical protein
MVKDFKNGSKDTQGGFSAFFKAGFAVANMEYRMSGQAKAPAAIEDTRCMIVYLIKNAKKLKPDWPALEAFPIHAKRDKDFGMFRNNLNIFNNLIVRFLGALQKMLTRL